MNHFEQFTLLDNTCRTIATTSTHMLNMSEIRKRIKNISVEMAVIKKLRYNKTNVVSGLKNNYDRHLRIKELRIELAELLFLKHTL